MIEAKKPSDINKVTKENKKERNRLNYLRLKENKLHEDRERSEYYKNHFKPNSNKKRILKTNLTADN